MNKRPDISTVGGRIKEKRLKKGYSQEKLAEILSISPALLSQYENDKVEPKLVVLRELAIELSTTVGYISNGEPELSPDKIEILKIYDRIGVPALRQMALEQMRTYNIINIEEIRKEVLSM